jgi:glycosyltransferase involved in cell wall biosynthesis
MFQPRISVVIPTYNRAYCISKAIQSIQNQTFPRWELLIVDDGSTDDTEKIVGSFSINDPRIRYVQQANSGASTARNYGVQESKGEIIVYVDSDDEVLPEFLETIIKKFDEC